MKLHVSGKSHAVFFVNLTIICCILLYIVWFTMDLKTNSFNEERRKFVSITPIVMQDIKNYMDNSSEIVCDWAKYASTGGTARDNVDGISAFNSNSDAMIQIVYADTLRGVSSVNGDGHSIDIDYGDTASLSRELKNFAVTSSEGDVLITSVFTNPVNVTQSIAFAKIVTLRDERGALVPAFLLRVEPVDIINKKWVIDSVYSDCSISVINKFGDYVLRSPMMKNTNFYEFLSSYNNIPYTKLQSLAYDVNSAETPGSFIMKNSAGKNTVFAYSTRSYNDWVVIAAIESSALADAEVQWPLIAVIILLFTVLIVYNQIYYSGLTNRLNVSLRELEEANRAKTDFLSSMSHDIRTPMNAIIGLTKIAMQNIDDKNSVRRSLTKISHAGKLLLTLINDILDISQIESGKIALKPEVFALEDSAANLTNILRQQADEKDLRYSVNMNKNGKTMIYADRLRLDQIWMNIISNAVKYTPCGGEVKIDFNCDDDAETGKIHLVFTVSDTGIGMSPEFMKNIFQPFERERDSRTDKVQGSGLGMAITKKIVDLFGGTIDVKSAVGAGSVFTVKLDLDRADAAQYDSAENSGTASDGDDFDIRPLIAEDNNLNWDIAEELLAMHGIKADRAVNGLQCVNILENADADKYNIVLMDIQMPVMNGYEAARRIRSMADPQKAHIPIIAMTADAFADDISACFDAGMNAHMAKPIDFDIMVGEMKKYIKGKVQNERIRKN